MGKEPATFEERPRSIKLDSSVYPLEVVQKALYWLADRASGRVDQEREAKIGVTLYPKNEEVTLDTLEADFFALLTDFSVRRQVDRETRSIRELIFAKALAASGALRDDVPGDDRDPVERSVEDGES